MSTTTAATVASTSRRRRRSGSYVRLEAEKKAESRANYVTAGILGVVMVALLISLGIIAFGLAG
ncbi:hypothetical protein [Hymenobacter psychrophilus]|uniref:hypothetical protein n=1 Tax=Hymenobacter psychrophilus TaxID=651662 RepID=UPI0011147981|nr:hypothetical protein [Hymenobacter psychrophilus]